MSPISQRWGTEPHQVLEAHTSIVDGPIVCIRCQVHCLVLELECHKAQN